MMREAIKDAIQKIGWPDIDGTETVEGDEFRDEVQARIIKKTMSVCLHFEKMTARGAAVIAENGIK